MMRWLCLLALASCSVSDAKDNPPPPAKIVPTLPCPSWAEDPWNRELAPGCAAMPYLQSHATCPRGTCPKPCAVEVESRTCCPVKPKHTKQTITYDTAGRWVSSQGGDPATGMVNWSCTFDGDKMDRCTLFHDGNEHLKVALKRDAKGRISEIEHDGLPLTVTYGANGRVATMSARRELTELRYDAKARLVKSTYTYKSDRSETTYTYNAAGSISEIRESGVPTKYTYDPRGRLAKVITTFSNKTTRTETMTYDEQDRLIELRHDGGEETSLWIYRYKYSCP